MKRLSTSIASGVLLLILLVSVATFFAAPRWIEGRIRERLSSEAQKRSLVFRLERVRFSWFAPLRLEGVEVEKSGGIQFSARRIWFDWRPARRMFDRLTSLSVESGRLTLGSGREILLGDATWNVLSLDAGHVALRGQNALDHLEAALTGRSGSRILDLSCTDLDLDRLATFRIDGVRPLRAGIWSGRIRLAEIGKTGIEFDVVASVRGFQVAALRDPAFDAGQAIRPEFGARSDFDLAAVGEYDRSGERLTVSCWHFDASGIEMSGAGLVATGPGDVWLDLEANVPRVELARVLSASGVELPAGSAPLGEDLGSVALSGTISGHLRDPDSIVVDQHLAFHPPRGGVPALMALRGPFTHTMVLPDGERRIWLSESSPDYVPLSEVPPLFIRALTLSEDASFWTHSGVDLEEMAIAFATNWLRGERSRGASTLSQQLVKNLFLSHRKSFSRKLQEFALTLLLESSLSKRRILEIYLNVIEWGPALYGLRPACRRYFGKEPRELTPKEMVFLISLIPSPIRYQTSFVRGSVTRGFKVLLGNLLAKLRSVDALTEEEYRASLSEELVFRAREGSGSNGSLRHERSQAGEGGGNVLERDSAD